jgi:hypothetical protein
MKRADALAELPDLVSAETSARYERWLVESTSHDAYLYTDARVRFDARPGDIVVAAPDLVASAFDGGTRLEAPALPRPLDIPGMPRERVERFLRSLDGERTLARAARDAGLSHADVAAVLGATFGIALFAPLAVLALERAVPSAEIVRFPGSPYEIPRNYWQNMAAARSRVPRLMDALEKPAVALTELRRLHSVALLGEDERSFYRPASPIARKGIGPSRLWLAASRTVETEGETRFVEGPRVSAQFLGGERYGALLADLAGDPAAAGEPLEHRDGSGLDWGRVVVARADGDERPAPWFCPPRPLTERHVSSLFESLAAGQVADFHQKFMRLHPFRAANQSVAMSIVNAALSSGATSGGPASGIPHLILDHLAFRLVPEAYRAVFALAARKWSVAGSPAERLRAYTERKLRYYAFVERIACATGAAEAHAVAAGAPGDARLSLLLVP